MFEFWRIHFVTPILNPRTTDPMVCDVPRGLDDSDFDGSARWGEKSFAPLSGVPVS